MAFYSFSTNPGFATPDNIALINSDIDAVILTRVDTAIYGDSITIEFTEPLSYTNAMFIQNVVQTRDFIIIRGDKVITYTPKSYIKTPTFKLCCLIASKKWRITHVEVSSYMDTGLTDYTVRLYDPNTGNVICEKTLTNLIETINDLGTISNLPDNIDTTLEIQVKVTPNNTENKYAYVNNVVIYYSL